MCFVVFFCFFCACSFLKCNFMLSNPWYWSWRFCLVEQTYTLNIPWHIGNVHPRHVQYTVHGIPEIQTLRLKRNDNININVPTCVIDQGFTICEYGNIQVSILCLIEHVLYCIKYMSLSRMQWTQSFDTTWSNVIFYDLYQSKFKKKLSENFSPTNSQIFGEMCIYKKALKRIMFSHRFFSFYNKAIYHYDYVSILTYIFTANIKMVYK